MCGFAGYINFSHQPYSQDVLSKMSNTLRLRGPDEESFYQDEALSFVFRRLSIIDVEGGAQPIWNEDQSIFVAVNGEIYNHQELHKNLKQPHTFRTESDSEIILHLYEEYGVEALELLNGMYAIMIWDTKNQLLMLARDRLGIKPLYYSQTEHGLLFGSELKALLMHPECSRTLSWKDLSAGIVQQKSPVSTYVDGIYHLPAGHFAFYQKNKQFSPKPYWDITEFFDSNSGDKVSIEKKYQDLLTDSVKKQLMSDVPVGLFLSGGVDSSIIAALLAQETTDVHCFTVVERTTYRAGDVEQARKIAESFGLPFYPVYFDVDEIANQFSLRDFENLICLIESPRFDPEWLFKRELHRAAKSLVPELKVILLGQGADEFCGGYSKYLGSQYTNWDDYLLQLKQSMNDLSLLHQHVPERFTEQLNPAALAENQLATYHQKMKMLTFQLQQFGLWHEDRTSSYFGIESRVPFLDHRLVELLASVPEKNQETLFWNKQIVRNIAEHCLPDYPKDHPKVPFFATDDTSSIDEFAKSICQKIYSAFKEKYVVGNSALFHIDELDELYSNMNTRNANAWRLLEIISICIFQQYCLKPDTYLENFLNDDKEALPLVRSSEWAGLKQKFEKSKSSKLEEWSLQSIVNVPQDCEIMNPLTEEEGTTALILLCKGKEKYRININDDNDWIVMMLDAMGRYTKEPKDIEFWAQKTKVDPGELVGILNNLVQGGFLERI